jgi:hypothetical protein
MWWCGSTRPGRAVWRQTAACRRWWEGARRFRSSSDTWAGVNDGDRKHQGGSATSGAEKLVPSDLVLSGLMSQHPGPSPN